jgi:hypothetical protein
VDVRFFVSPGGSTVQVNPELGVDMEKARGNRSGKSDRD